MTTAGMKCVSNQIKNFFFIFFDKNKDSEFLSALLILSS